MPPPHAGADFADGSLAGWSFTDPAAFAVAKTPKGNALALEKPSKHQPKVRSPLAIAWWDAGGAVADFQLTVQARSTVKHNNAHRDLCLFFGKQAADKFYYVHFARAADPAAHSIFLVNGQPRVSIAAERTKGIEWHEDWHALRVVRTAATGAIAVYFDDLAKPIMQATDKTFASGPIGVGSFDDLGWFRDVELRGKRP
jgi:hypothetical protein